MPINIHGKEYVTVNERVQMLHESDLTEITLNTEILHDSEQSIVMKTTLEIDGKVFTGIAQETKGSTNINKTSAYENCETSAVGRALGFAGYGSVESIASGDEVAHAIKQQEQLEPEYATPNQVKYIQNLCQEKAMDCEYDFEKMTKQEAGSVIEGILNKS
tara:strand:+ start:1867 stop:2349 length:483 start_codon:yes stop_codon:yes gene_type:complete